MQDRQDRSIGCRIEKFVRMPACGHPPGLRLAVPDAAGDDGVRIIEGRAVPMTYGVAQLATSMDRARRFGSYVDWNPAGKRELLEQPFHSLFILRNIRINFAIRPLQVSIGDQSGSTVSRSRDIDHVQVMRLNRSV